MGPRGSIFQGLEAGLKPYEVLNLQLYVYTPSTPRSVAITQTFDAYGAIYNTATREILNPTS